METSKRRRSSRLLELEADSVDDGTKSIGSSTDDGTTSSLKRKSKTKNQTAQTRSSRSIGRRRTRSGSESTSSSTTSKRAKRISKSDLSVSTQTNVSTTTTNRRRTRTLSNQIVRMQSKTVTPSPVSTTGTTKFSFASPSKATDERKRSHGEYDSDDESSNGIPPGVVNLYREKEDETEMRTSLAAFQSPPNRRARTRQATKQHQLERWSDRQVRPMVLATAEGNVFDSSTSESLTIDYIRSYGEDYWQSLHASEHPIICDTVSNKIKKDKPSAETPESSDCNENYPFGSPTRGRHSSASSSSTSTSKVTPDSTDYMSRERWIAKTNSLLIEREKYPQPHVTIDTSKNIPVQPQLTPKMRSILVDWLIELSEHFSFRPSTLHLAVTMVDRVLASGTERMVHIDSYNRDMDQFDDDSYDSDSYNEDDDNTRCYLIPRDRFQLLGVTCVWLACKIKETKTPKASQIAYVSDHIYTSEQITRMERRICNALNFSFLEAPTPHQFLFEFMRASSAGCAPVTQDQKLPAKNDIPAAAMGVGTAFKSVFRDMTHYLLELGRLPYGPTGKNPSLLAAAAVYLARVTLGIPRTLKDSASSSFDSDPDTTLDPLLFYWTPTLKYYTGYTQSDLKETVLEIHKYQMAAESSNLKAAYNKYKQKDYNRVALKTVVREEDLGFS